MAVTERRWGQPQTVQINMSAVMAKYGKSIGDISKAIVTLKRREGISDSLAAYNKNSTDHASQVSYAEVSSELIVTAIVAFDDFGDGSNLVEKDKEYFVGCGLVFSDEDAEATFELDTYPADGNKIKFISERVG